MFALLFADNRNNTDGSGLLIYHTQCHFIGNDTGNGSCLGISRNGNHIRPTEQTQVMASNFSIVKAPQVAASIILWSSLTGINAPQTTYIRGCHNTTLFHLVV